MRSSPPNSSGVSTMWTSALVSLASTRWSTSAPAGPSSACTARTPSAAHRGCRGPTRAWRRCRSVESGEKNAIVPSTSQDVLVAKKSSRWARRSMSRRRDRWPWFPSGTAPVRPPAERSSSRPASVALHVGHRSTAASTSRARSVGRPITARSRGHQQRPLEQLRVAHQHVDDGVGAWPRRLGHAELVPAVAPHELGRRAPPACRRSSAAWRHRAGRRGSARRRRRRPARRRPPSPGGTWCSAGCGRS